MAEKIMECQDPVVIRIHETFDRILHRVNMRRREVLESYLGRLSEQNSNIEEGGLKLKSMRDRIGFQANALREMEAKLLDTVDQAEITLKESRNIPLKFECNLDNVEKEIACVGKIVLDSKSQSKQMKCNFAVGKHGRSDREIWKPRGIAIDEDSKDIFVVDGFGSCRVMVFEDSGKRKENIVETRMLSPYGIALDGRGFMYVTDCDAHAVFQFKMETRSVTQFGNRKGSGDEELNCPLGITTSIYGEIFIADSNNNRIKILDQSMQPKAHIGNRFTIKPLDVKVTQNEAYILCDTSPCIHVFSIQGDEKLKTLVEKGPGLDVMNPRFFCLGATPHRKLILSDQDADDIKIFRSDGTHVCTSGQSGNSEGMLRLPQGIARTSDGCLVIASQNLECGLQKFSWD